MGTVAVQTQCCLQQRDESDEEEGGVAGGEGAAHGACALVLWQQPSWRAFSPTGHGAQEPLRNNPRPLSPFK